MDWAYVLVIILSIFLAMFLLLSVILVILLIRVTVQIKSVTESAKRTATSIEDMVTSAGRISSSGLLIRSIIKQVQKFKKEKK